MKVIYDVGKIKGALKGAVLAIGVFDGLHIGHQKLIKTAVRRAKALRKPVMVMTFFPHPVEVLRPEEPFIYIVSLEHRLKLIEAMGVDACLVVRFTKQFSRQTAERFVKKYLVDHIQAQEVFVGQDFRFGRDRLGTLDYFKRVGAQYGLAVKFVAPVKTGRKKIGSSRIRSLIAEGRLRIAERYLGRKVSVLGKVTKGDGRGKKLGFPTANLKPQNQVLPPVGVYAVRIVCDDKTFKGMANIGRRPSFKKDARVNIEVHIFDFQKNIYGKNITVEFIKRIRKEKKFTSAEKVQAQLERDERKARGLLK